MKLTIEPPGWSGSAKSLLMAAAQAWDNTHVSEQYIQQALAQQDAELDRLDVLIGAYRYYFYKSNTARAISKALAVCDRIQNDNQWPAD